MHKLAASLWSHLANVDHTLTSFGGPGARYAAIAILLILVVIALSRVLKLSFGFLYKIILPAALLAWLAGAFLRFPFLAVFPVLVALGSAWALFKPAS